jgi:hypothetical protein
MSTWRALASSNETRESIVLILGRCVGTLDAGAAICRSPSCRLISLQTNKLELNNDSQRRPSEATSAHTNTHTDAKFHTLFLFLFVTRAGPLCRAIKLRISKSGACFVLGHTSSSDNTMLAPTPLLATTTTPALGRPGGSAAHMEPAGGQTTGRAAPAPPAHAATAPNTPRRRTPTPDGMQLHARGACPAAIGSTAQPHTWPAQWRLARTSASSGVSRPVGCGRAHGDVSLSQPAGRSSRASDTTTDRPVVFQVARRARERLII